MSDRTALLRADASSAIGTGHVVRSTVLGAALAASGWDVVLASRELPDALAAEAQRSGLRVVRIPGVAEPADEAEIIGRLLGRQVDILVADHYDLDGSWFDAMAIRQPGAVRMAIDDLGTRWLPVDLLVNQNLGSTASAYSGLLPQHAIKLLGPRYALVAPAFAALRPVTRRRNGVVRRVLVFTSGADIPNVTAMACRALTDFDLDVDVVVGPAYPYVARLRRLLATRTRFRIHRNTTRMAELMAAADLAIGAPSSASWERCTLGLPAIVIVLADNQAAVGRELADIGAVMNLGVVGRVGIADIASAIGALVANPDRLVSMAAAAGAITDGRGVERVVSAVGQLTIGHAEEA